MAKSRSGIVLNRIGREGVRVFCTNHLERRKATAKAKQSLITFVAPSSLSITCYSDLHLSAYNSFVPNYITLWTLKEICKGLKYKRVARGTAE